MLKTQFFVQQFVYSCVMCIIPLATLVCYLFVLHHFFMCKRQYTA